MPRPLMAMWPPVVIWLALFAAFAWMLLDRLLALDPGTEVAIYVGVIGGLTVVLAVGVTAFLVFAFAVSLILIVEWLDDRVPPDVSLVAVAMGFWAFAGQSVASIVLVLVLPPPALSLNYDAWWQLDEELANLEALEIAGMLQAGAIVMFLALVIWRLRGSVGLARAGVAVGAAASVVTFVLALFNRVAPGGSM